MIPLSGKRPSRPPDNPSRYGADPCLWSYITFRGTTMALGQCIPRARPAQGMPDRGRALDVRSCAHVDIDSTEVFGLRGDRVSEREELDLDCAERGTQV